MVFDLGTREPDGREVLRDIKTANREPAENAAEESEQLTVYALGRKIQTGSIPDVALDFVVSQPKRGGAVWLTERTSTRTENDLQTIIHRMNNAIESARAGVFVANGPGNWYCSSKFCRFHPTCKFVGKG